MMLQKLSELSITTGFFLLLVAIFTIFITTPFLILVALLWFSCPLIRALEARTTPTIRDYPSL